MNALEAALACAAYLMGASPDDAAAFTHVDRQPTVSECAGGVQTRANNVGKTATTCPAMAIPLPDGSMKLIMEREARFEIQVHEAVHLIQRGQGRVADLMTYRQVVELEREAIAIEARIAECPEQGDERNRLD